MYPKPNSASDLHRLAHVLTLVPLYLASDGNESKARLLVIESVNLGMDKSEDWTANQSG